MSGPASWLSSVAGAAFVSAVELDGVQVGQFMLSRPLVLGPLLGLLFGVPETGLALGLCGELLSLDDLPLGGNLPLNVTVAVSAALLLTCGPRPVPPELALPAGLLAGWAHRCLETSLRHRRREYSSLAESRVRQGARPPWGRLIAGALAEQAAGTFAVLLVCVFVAGPALRGLWPYAPRVVVVALAWAWWLAPWLGLGSAAYALRVNA